MPTRFQDIRVSYSDFIRLFRVRNPDRFGVGLRVAIDGVWVNDLSEDHLLICEERAILSEHPDGDPNSPVITFPCTLEDVRVRICDYYDFHDINAMDMAEFLLSKLSSSEVLPSKASNAQAERRARDREQLLRVAFGVLWNYPPEQKTAAAFARQLDEKALLFWPDDGRPPLELRALTKLISSAMKEP